MATDWEEFLAELKEIIKKISEEKRLKRSLGDPDNIQAFKKLKQKGNDGDDAAHDLYMELKREFWDDFDQILKLMKSEYAKMAKVPVLDGLFGGKPCQREYADKSIFFSSV